MRRPLAWPVIILVIILAVLPAAAGAADLSSSAFVVQATGAIRFQMASGNLALRKTKNDHVLALANQMIFDNTVAGMKLRQAIADAKLPAPRDAIDAAHKPAFEALGKTPPGKAFAKAYPEMLDKVLRDDLALYEAYARDGDNERLKFFAGEMVPVLRGQLDRLAK